MKLNSYNFISASQQSPLEVTTPVSFSSNQVQWVTAKVHHAHVTVAIVLLTSPV